MKDNSVGAGLIRVRHVGRAISGGPEMNAENIRIAVHALRRVSRAQRASQQVVHLPKEALAAVGVASTDELEVVVRDREIVLRPKHRQ
ncbi:MAG: AbrB/MazE/SpoVT family DNA-binding domain-containing protein [Trueperaceae bacterium]